jgi:MSHA biogenesis protein MshI
MAAEGSGICAAAVRRAGGVKPRVTACESFSGEQSLPALAAWRRKSGLRRSQANLLLGGDEYQIVPIDALELTGKELAEAARWKVKDMIDFPPEQASIACVLVPGTDAVTRARQALAVVTPRKTVALWMQRSLAANLELNAIDVPELALRNVAALVPSTTACGLLHVGLARTTLVMVWQGELCTFRRFDLKASQFVDANTEQREALVERLALDLQRTTDAFERQFHATALGRMWVTDEIEGLALGPALSRYVASEVLPLKLREYLDIDHPNALVDPAHGIDFIPAIGAALREAGLSAAPGRSKPSKPAAGVGAASSAQAAR